MANLPWTICCPERGSFIIILNKAHFCMQKLLKERLIQRGHSLYLRAKTGKGGDRTCLPKFKFSAKFPIGLHMILELHIKKILNLLESDAQNYFNRKSIGVHRAALHPSLNTVKWSLFSNNTAIRMLLTVALPGCCHPVLPH